MNFQYLDHLPTIPLNLVKDIVDIASGVTPSNYTNLYYGRSVKPNINIVPSDSLGHPMNTFYNHFKKTVHIDFLDASNLLRDWILENILPKPDFVSIQSMTGWHTLIPHVDVGRATAYNYIISGAGADLCFWKPIDKFRNLKAYPQTIFTYEMLELDEKICPELNRWHSLDVTKIHSVENINTSRVSLSLSYTGIQ